MADIVESRVPINDYNLVMLAEESMEDAYETEEEVDEADGKIQHNQDVSYPMQAKSSK